MGLNGAYFQRNTIMGSNAINIGWNKYEVALLIDAYFTYQSGDSARKDVVMELSKRLRARMKYLGMSISDTYRNENGIDLQMRAMEFVLTDGEHGMNHPPKIFIEIGDLYANDKKKFDCLLSIANVMFPKIAKTDTPSLQHKEVSKELSDVRSTSLVTKATLHTTLFEDEGFSVADEILDLNLIDEIKKVLSSKFSNGYRLDSFMEYNRMKSFYKSEYGKDLELDRAGVDNYVESCGIIYEGRVYLPERMLSDNEAKQLIRYIKSCFDDGIKCVYYSVVFDYIKSAFPDNKVFSDKMLSRYLQHMNKENWHFHDNFLSHDANVEIDILEEVCNFVREQGGVVTEDEVVKGLSHFPEEKIRHAFDERKTKMICCGRNQRFHIDNFVITDDELFTIECIITKAIDQFRYIGFSELLSDIKIQVPSVIVNNSVFGDIGLKNVLVSRLENKFHFYNNIISDKDNPISTEDCFRDLAQHSHFTIDDVTRLAEDCGSLPNLYIEMFFKYSVRIDQNNYVSRNQVHFNIEETDKVLSKFCKKDYITIGEVSPMETLPDCGYPWNEFLLECYAFAHSKAFTIIHSKYFGQKNAVGGIVRRNSQIKDFVTLAAYALADSNCRLNKEEALQYLWENQYISQRRLDVIDDILNRAKQIKAKNN